MANGVLIILMPDIHHPHVQKEHDTVSSPNSRQPTVMYKEYVLILTVVMVGWIHLWVFLNQYGLIFKGTITVESNPTALFRKQVPHFLWNKIRSVTFPDSMGEHDI